ncbi:ATP-binding cassette subfamily C protein CydD [Virgibacillus natechei]|uniref:ATP-binding cassette subfamily C protein CydD n=1 Tax=Virgibacillus natechei TaxID=1216297 RepID=A0ABS4IBT6_9BACI|nr:thiol reductant ABC exporter subunit CydD [Virgibacillus natechei]MBP1968318.1 ATP-binding cassette subfamily C protein CydD [Virgibacillus natechei]UZD13453.1 thiol reductant ABC exporter subunit CydD [Virgibacillus natechei]
MKNLREIAIAQKSSMLFLFLSSVITGIAIIFQAYFIVAIVDRIFLKGASFNEILPLLGGLLLVLLGRTMFTYMSGRKGVKMASKVKGDFRKSILNRYSRNPVQTSLQGQSGQKVSVMMDAVDGIESYFSEYIPQMIRTTFIPLLVLVIVFTQHVNSGLIMLITAPFIPIFFIIIGMKTKTKSEEQMDKLAAFSGRFLDILQGLTTLKLFGRAKRQKEEIGKSSLNFREATMEILKIAFTSSFMLELISMLSIGLVALELAIQLIIYESISFFTAFFVLVLVPEFYTSLKELGSTFHNGRSSMGAAEKVTGELAETEQSISWGEGSLRKDATPPSIHLQLTGYRYGEEQFELKNVNAEIPPFGQIAIVGRSGSGKTTLLHLIAGLIAPSTGEININGSPRSDYKEKDWFDQLSYISQHPYIFAGTIAENIAIGGGLDASRAHVEQAAEQAGISEMIKSLENGYDTSVGEAGRGLSGGEKQRIAIARAFLKQPSVILFDEPTTGLDLHTERILQTSIRKLSEKATVITVAHRLHTIKNVDQILFLENGALVAVGTHEQLIENVAEYRDMVSVQQGGMSE